MSNQSIFSKQEDELIRKAYKEHKQPAMWLFKNTEMKDKFTKRQIIHRASLLGASKKKYPPFSEEENEIITRAYSTQKNPLQFLLNKTILGVTRRGYSIQQQASRLGVTRSKAYGRYSAREKEIIVSRIGECSVSEIVRALKNQGFYRRADGIRRFIYLSGRPTARGDRYSQKDLLRIFKCSVRKIQKWNKMGVLRPVMKDGAFYYYRPIDVAKFIRYHPFELESHHIDIPWLVSLFEEFWNIMNSRAKG
jgi:hypothetical protein